MDEEVFEDNILVKLPWEDILFRFVFPHLSLFHLFKFRAGSKLSKQCVQEYFLQMQTLKLVNLGSKFTNTTLEIITKDSCFIKTLLARKASDWLSSSALIPIIERNKYLRKVDLSMNTAINNDVIWSLATSCGKSLQELTLRECHWLNGESITQLTLHCPELKKLDLTGCWNIQDSAVINLSMMCKKIEFLSLCKIYGITDSSIYHIATNLSELRHINLEGCWRISDRSVFLLAEYCKHLKVLQVKECRDVTMACLERLHNTKHVLRIDVVTSKPKLTAAHYRYMKGLPM